MLGILRVIYSRLGLCLCARSVIDCDESKMLKSRGYQQSDTPTFRQFHTGAQTASFTAACFQSNDSFCFHLYVNISIGLTVHDFFFFFDSYSLNLINYLLLSGISEQSDSVKPFNIMTSITFKTIYYICYLRL